MIRWMQRDVMARSGLAGLLVLLALVVTGCASGSGANVTSDTTGNGGGGFVGGGNTSAPTPPPFPVFTVGAWIADMSPAKGAQDRLYVLTRVHDPSMATASQPPAPGSTQVSVVIDSVSQGATTDSDGFAVFDFTANAPPSVPSVVHVSATYQGNTYSTTTFYTVLPDVASPTPGPGTPHP